MQALLGMVAQPLFSSASMEVFPQTPQLDVM